MFSRVTMLVVVLAISGCTHTVKMPLRQDFTGNLKVENQLAKVRPAVSISPGSYLDRRPDPSVLVTFKQQVHTYNLVEERPIRDALFEGLQTLLSSSGHEWRDTGGSIQVNLELVNVQAARNAGLVSVGARSSIQVKLDFIDLSTGQMVYTQIYTGTDDRSQALVGLMGMVKASVDASIIDCIQRVGDDAMLAKALNGSR